MELSHSVKLSGDGANIAASATMVFLTFSFPDLEQNVLSAAGNIYTAQIQAAGNIYTAQIQAPYT